MYLCCIENHLKLKDMTRQDIITDLFRVVRENDTEHFPLYITKLSRKTIWEIFCHQNNIDEESNGLEAQVFDSWCDIWLNL
jgi:hypothetical protein